MTPLQFDLVISNPPYNNNADLKLLREILPLTKEAIVVHPGICFFNRKNIKKLYTDFKREFEHRLKSIEIFDGNSVFGIRLYYGCVITHFVENNQNQINVIDKINNTTFHTNSIQDVTKWGFDWLIIKPFFEQIKSFCLRDNVQANVKNVPNDLKFNMQISTINGDDLNPYIIIPKNKELSRGIKNEKYFGTANCIIFHFDSEIEQENFIDYCRTDFARFCLSFYKNNQHLARGELKIVPWMDFTQKWTDEKLYKFFNVSEEIQTLINKYIKPYYAD